MATALLAVIQPAPVRAEVAAAHAGLTMVAGDGRVYAFGDAWASGSTRPPGLQPPAADIVPTYTGEGYWLVTARGDVLGVGDAPALTPVEPVPAGAVIVAAAVPRPRPTGRRPGRSPSARPRTASPPRCSTLAAGWSVMHRSAGRLWRSATTPGAGWRDGSRPAGSVGFDYDDGNRLTGVRDPTGRLTRYGYDAADRTTSMTLPSGRTYRWGYDAGGDPTEITMPSGAVHRLSYTAGHQLAGYTPPGSVGYVFEHDADRARTATRMPTGRTETLAFDQGGRLTGIAYPEADVAVDYADATGRVAALTRADADGPEQRMTFDHLGPLTTGADVTGPAAGRFTYRYDAFLRPAGTTLDGGSATNLTYDGDDLPVADGTFTFGRGADGTVTRISGGTLVETRDRDEVGRLTGVRHDVGGERYRFALSHHPGGSVARRVEAVAGAEHTFDYTYDDDGQLTRVARDGLVIERYGYDANGNRTSRQLGAGPAENATYDAQDRLTGQGATPYTWDDDGYLTGRGADRFRYSTRGELLEAVVGGHRVRYGYDALGRRVTRTDETGTTRYLYGNLDRVFEVTAVRAPSGRLTEHLYDDAGHLIALRRDDVRYSVAGDQLGSPRLVVDGNGTVVKQIRYDAFGRPVGDTAPEFDLAIGFAGGIGDNITGLVRFGVRDYDPDAGRWIARDPALYDGRQANLYQYAGNDPVGQADPSGLVTIGFTAYDIIGGGLKLSFTTEGFSFCGEVGLGVGLTAEFDPASGLDYTTAGVFGEAKANLFGLGKASVKIDVKNPCGTSLGPVEEYDVKLTPEACAGVVCTNFEEVPGGDVKYKGDPRKVAPSFKPGLGVELKGGVKYCGQLQW